WQTALGLGFLSSVFNNIPLTALALKQGGYDWGYLAYTVGFGGSMVWFGSSAGVAISNMYPEAKSVGLWLKHGWSIAIATSSASLRCLPFLADIAMLRCANPGSPALARRVESRRCKSSDAIRGEADIARAARAGRSVENDPKRLSGRCRDRIVPLRAAEMLGASTPLVPDDPIVSASQSASGQQ